MFLTPLKILISFTILQVASSAIAPKRPTITGMYLRLNQQSLGAAKQFLTRTLPSYLDAQDESQRLIPSTYHIHFCFLDIGILQEELFTFDILWWNIDYKQMDLQMDKFYFEILPALPEEGFEQGLIKLDFPSLKYWKITAMQRSNTWFLANGPVALVLQNFRIGFAAALKLDQYGYLDPIVYNTTIHFGESYVEQDDWFLNIVVGQMIELLVVMIENTSWFMGEYIFTETIGPVFDKLLNHYKMPLKIGGSKFEIDFRNTADPYIGEGFLDFQMSGDLLYRGRACPNMGYNPIAPHDVWYSQLVLSESLATCWANQIAQSPAGKLVVTLKWLRKKFRKLSKDFDLSTTGLKQTVPILATKLGEDVPLSFAYTFADMKVYFRNNDRYEIHAIARERAMVDKSDPRGPQFMKEHKMINDGELYYHEVPVVLKFRMKINTALETKIYPQIEQFNINLQDSAYGESVLPRRNNIGFTEAEYRELVTQSSIYWNYVRNELNNAVFRRGIKNPWNMGEFEYVPRTQSGQLSILLLEKV